MIYCAYLSHHTDGGLAQVPYPGMPGELEGDVFTLSWLAIVLEHRQWFYEENVFWSAGDLIPH